MAITLTSHGAAREVTGSNHLLDVDGKKILVDCGLFQGRRMESEEKNRQFHYESSEISSIVLTHGHCDHSCRIPCLCGDGFDGNIYSTPATRDIAGLIMADTAHIQAKDAEWLRKKKIGKPFKPLFGINEVTKALNQFMTISYGRDFFLEGGVKGRFQNASHILGAASVLLDLGEDRRVVFTGDMGRKGQPVIRDPDPLPDADYLICEATYGNRRHDPIEDARRQLRDVIRETVDKGGKVIIPAFAVERTQDIIYHLGVLLSERQIPKLDIFVDSPMAFNATSVFRIHQECFDEDTNEIFLERHLDPFGFEKLTYITDVSKSKALNDRKEPCIIISSSGMCEAGRILHHLKNNVENPRNTILIVGYMAEHTLGRRIADRDPEVRIFGRPYPLRARVKILNTFSSHADYEDLKDMVGAMDLNRLREVFLVHGEDDSLTHLREELLGIGVKAVTIVDPKTPYPLFQ